MSEERRGAIAHLATAFERTQRTLFSPFELNRYVALAVSAWLAQLGSQSWSRASLPSRSDAGGWFPGDWFDLRDQFPTATGLGVVVVAVLAVALVVGVAFGLAILYLQCRGNFMFVDNLVRERAEVAEPWALQAEPATALFLFRVAVSLVGLGVAVVSIVAAGGLVYGTLEAAHPSVTGMVGGMAILTVGLGGAGLLLGGLDWVVTELAAPIMYLRRCSAGEALGEVRALAAADPATFLVYLVVRVVLAFVLAALAGLIGCVLCGVSWIPFVGTLPLLPLHVYLRHFTLAFLAEQSDELRVLSPTGDA